MLVLFEVMTAAWGEDAPIEDEGGDDVDYDAIEDDAYMASDDAGDSGDSFPAEAEDATVDADAGESLDRELSALDLRVQELQRLVCCYNPPYSFLRAYRV